MTDEAWPLGCVALKVLDLTAEVEFYQRLGMTLLDRGELDAALGVPGRILLRLRQLNQGRPRPPRTAGLYHFAILLPAQADLSGFLRYGLDGHLPFVGASDHFVSQALYLQDPEGNGIEVYADRPRENWTWSNGSLDIGTAQLDLSHLMELSDQASRRLPDGAVLGHMHLNVANLDASQRYYESLGMRLMADAGWARFLSWNGYHHHLAVNLLEGRMAGPVQPDVSGVESFAICGKAPASRRVLDPDGVGVTTSAATCLAQA